MDLWVPLWGTEPMSQHSGTVWCQKKWSGEGNGILETMKSAGPLSHIASYRRRVTRWCNRTYRSENHQESADVHLYLLFLPHTARAFSSCSKKTRAWGFTLVPVAGRSKQVQAEWSVMSTWWDGKSILLEEQPSNSGQQNLCWETYGRRSSALFWLLSSGSRPSFASVLWWAHEGSRGNCNSNSK